MARPRKASTPRDMEVEESSFDTPVSIFESICPFDDPDEWDAMGYEIDPDDLVTD